MVELVIAALGALVVGLVIGWLLASRRGVAELAAAKVHGVIIGRVRGNIGRNIGVESRSGAQFLVPMRITQEAHAIARGEGHLAADGPLVVATGRHTGRSAQDKFIVRDAETESTVWWGKTNKAMSPEGFAALKADFLAALGEQDTLFVQDLFGGSQPANRVNVRVITQLAWHSLFIRTMLVRPSAHDLAHFAADYTIIDLPSFRADPERHEYPARPDL